MSDIVIENQIVMKRINEIKPYIRNPRKNDKTVDLLCKIIPKVGFNVPLVIDERGIIVKGHARFSAAIRLGMTELPCIITHTDFAKRITELTKRDVIINPLGNWTGGINVDTGATNRKLGSDMGDAVTGGGLHGKDLSKADVSINIYAHLKAVKSGRPVRLYCAIGDKYIDGLPYSAIVEVARDYINGIGGFEKFAEWGLI